MKAITIGIIGSRRRDSFQDFRKVDQAVAKFTRTQPKGIRFRIVSGGCSQGGDRFAEIIAACSRWAITIHRPDAKQLDPLLLQKVPRAAWAKINYARNTLIAQDADVLVACVAKDRRGGTEDTIRKWRKLHPGQEPILV